MILSPETRKLLRPLLLGLLGSWAVAVGVLFAVHFALRATLPLFR